jgi:hypothetical protein
MLRTKNVISLVELIQNKSGGLCINNSPDVPEHDCVRLASIIQQHLGHVLRHAQLLCQDTLVKLFQQAEMRHQ